MDFLFLPRFVHISWKFWRWQQTHLICTVPPYADPDIIEPVTVQLIVTSSNKFSEPHNFVYTPKSAFGPGALAMASTLASLQHAPHPNNIQGIIPVAHNYLPNQNILSEWVKKPPREQNEKKKEDTPKTKKETKEKNTHSTHTHNTSPNDAVSRSK